MSDSKSGLTALQKVDYAAQCPLVAGVNERLRNLKKDGRMLCMTWVPSHCSLIGNEWADEAANEAAGMDQSGVNWSFAIARARITNLLQRRVLTHTRAKAIYGGGGVKVDVERGLRREELRSFRRFRMGHSLELRQYGHRIGNEASPNCRKCGEEAESTEHVLLDCPAMREARRRLGIGDMGDLCRRPLEAAELWLGFKAEPPPRL